MSATEIRPDAEVDQQTKNELQLPCDVKVTKDRDCEEPARWIVDAITKCCGNAWTRSLQCQGHFGRIVADGLWRCTRCGSATTLTLLKAETL